MVYHIVVRTVLIFAVLLFASTVPSRAQTSPNLTTIRVISSPSDDLRPMLYAQKAGLFTKAGLNVVLERSSSGAVVAQAIVGGAMDVGKASLSSLIAAYARGIPFELIAPSAIHRASSANSAVIVTTASPIRAPLDLQNKTVSCTAIGDIGYLGLRAMIDAQGGDSSTVKWVEIPTSAVALAIEQGRVDAGVTTEPYMTKDLRSGKVRILVDMLNGYPRPILESAFFATKDYVEKNRDVVARFAKALQQASSYSNTHEAETVPLFAAFGGLDADTAAQMHRTFTPTTFDAAQIQPVIDLAAKYKVIPRRFDAREFIAVSR
ncbi:MAG TPA: ABC transporter substrate-binding protein [Candidatus Acidoferrales bacterium]|nr:ABC transporter substrate-binding protein [Candidatus Acidoferrales bacterium]